MNGRLGIAGRLLSAQLIVLLVAGATLIITVVLLAPGLFRYHLQHAGEDSPIVQLHAQEAFETAFAIAFGVAAVAALATAGGLFWLLSRRISRPVEDLAAAASSIADGDYAVAVPAGGYGRELTSLAESFQRMADRLAATDAARSRMLADLAHELRTPLATLEAHIDGIEDGIVAPAPQTYETMRGQVDRLRRLAGDLRLISDAQEQALHLALAEQPLPDLLAVACDAAAPRYSAKGVQLRCIQGPQDTTVCVDADRIGQVLANLLDNALRHTPPGGSVALAGGVHDSTAEITVSDTGDGIPDDQLEAVFDRFHRTDSARASHQGGTGLGLTIARAIAQAHGGSLTAASNAPGPGATMTLRLPVEVGQVARPV